MNAHRRTLSPPWALRCVAQLLLAVEYLHHERILHRDIKPGNIFLDIDARRGCLQCVMLGDFGVSRGMNLRESLAYSHVGTPLYLPPETLVRGDPYSRASDLWSVGCVLVELLTGMFAFGRCANLGELGGKALAGRYGPLPRGTGADVRDLVRTLLHPVPGERKTAGDVLLMPALLPHTAELLGGWFVHDGNVAKVKATDGCGCGGGGGGGKGVTTTATTTTPGEVATSTRWETCPRRLHLAEQSKSLGVNSTLPTRRLALEAQILRLFSHPELGQILMEAAKLVPGSLHETTRLAHERAKWEKRRQQQQQQQRQSQGQGQGQELQLNAKDTAIPVTEDPMIPFGDSQSGVDAGLEGADEVARASRPPSAQPLSKRPPPLNELSCLSVSVTKDATIVENQPDISASSSTSIATSTEEVRPLVAASLSFRLQPGARGMAGMIDEGSSSHRAAEHDRLSRQRQADILVFDLLQCVRTGGGGGRTGESPLRTCNISRS